jgi:photosystem II stability/assembly factor-like uncharacterized protein
MPPKINRVLIPICIACLLLLSSYFSSAGQTIPNISYLPFVSDDLSGWLGPYGGYIISIAINPTNPQVVYAASWGSGIFKSQDGGENWQPANKGLGNLYVNSLVVDPTQPTILYAGTYKSQVYKSIDGGNTWVWSGTGMQDQAIVYSIAIDPLAPATLYAAARGVSNNGNPPWNGVVYKSGNAGQTWNPVLTNVGGEDVQDWAYSLAVNPNAHNNVYAAFHEHGPYHSSDSGESWGSIHDGINDDSGRSIIISPESTNGETMYYGVWHFDAVYKSMDGGNDWLLTNRGIPWAKIYSMTIDPIQTDTVFLATFTHGILKSLDGGGSWKPAGLQDDRIYHVAIDPNSTSTLFVGTAGDGLHKSMDGGKSWQEANAGIENTMPTTVLVSPSDPQRLFASIYGAGVYQSTNHGQNWSEMNIGLGDKFVHTIVQDPTQPEVIFALTNTGGLYKDDINSGIGWVSLDQGLLPTQAPQSVYPSDYPFATHEMQEMITIPDGNSTADLPTGVSLVVMTYAPSNPQIAYLGTGGSGVYKSTDAGLNWLPAGLDGELIQSLAVDLVDQNLVYAATATPGSLKISLDGGDSWTDSSLPVTFYSLVTSPTIPGLLYAGTSNGLYFYQSGSWVKLGLSDQVITAIAIDPLHPDQIYAGTTDNGAFFTSDGGYSWQIVDRDLNGLTIQSINLNPVAPNDVYFSTKTHGIYLATFAFTR